MSAFIDLTGHIFGRLTVIERGPNTANNHTRWWCACRCGKRKLIHGTSLRSEASQSCGCLQKEVTQKRSRTHGMTRTPEYYTWCLLRRRCLDPSDPKYPSYGGRGITVCDTWKESFSNFYRDMGPKPSSKHSIERLDNAQSYTPTNCIWATRTVQARNTRSNHLITIAGRTQCLAAWLEEKGLGASTYKARIKSHWSEEEALTTPPDPRHISKKYRHKNTNSV
jgi:hypothetical protein